MIETSFIDLTGNRYGFLTVIQRADDQIAPSGYKTVMWLCECDCGNTTIVSGKNLKKKKEPTVSCGCYSKSVKNDLTGNRYGRLIVTSRAPNKKFKAGGASVMYNCKCDCGNEVIVGYGNLKNGVTNSCGCFQKEVTSQRSKTHGLSKKRIYHIWIKMKYRCYNENSKDYKHYGARGIKIYDEWKNDFLSFYNWSINNGYDKSLSIDRINVNGDYSPDNCRWVDQITQMNNTRKNKYFILNGERMTIAQISRKYGINDETLRSRIKAGKNIASALYKPQHT